MGLTKLSDPNSDTATEVAVYCAVVEEIKTIFKRKFIPAPYYKVVYLRTQFLAKAESYHVLMRYVSEPHNAALPFSQAFSHWLEYQLCDTAYKVKKNRKLRDKTLCTVENVLNNLPPLQNIAQ
jgi:hypothetical protein